MALRLSVGLNEISLRPHAGEAGSTDHLAAAYLLARSINHGIELVKSESLNYFFYIHQALIFSAALIAPLILLPRGFIVLILQIGLSICPKSNDALFLPIANNPVKKFLDVGMNVAISTDGPMLSHLNTADPLLEVCKI